MEDAILKTAGHDRAYHRRMNWRKALRKRRIVRQYGFDYYDNLHQYSKNKIHCSCPNCRKTRNGNSTSDKKVSERRSLENMREQLNGE